MTRAQISHLTSAIPYRHWTETKTIAKPLIFFFNDTATTEIYTLSLHDALPISGDLRDVYRVTVQLNDGSTRVFDYQNNPQRSEEHTSELQSHLNLVCRLLLEKKKTPVLFTCPPLSVTETSYLGIPFSPLSANLL